RVAHLDLGGAPRLGVGNHSAVHRAALTLPCPLGPVVTVAAKTAFEEMDARKLLATEGAVYDAMPTHLQEDWSGLNLVAPLMHPVPVGAVAAKFYGYYVPVREDDAKESEEYELCGSESHKAWKRLSPILLLEECGEPIFPSAFTPDARSECYSLALRLHYAQITQNSFYVRNVLRQPGPLTVAPALRSLDTPSFRIIDFGRGEAW
ncbi:hypothetical protein B0H10DRAFT_1629162, partial [Mycena sp. CBHHK59/15]